MTRDPFLIESPAVISFSGGRTSGYMLRRILDAHGGVLPDDVRVVFANTGKERQETLDFVQACSKAWGVEVTWVEYRCEPDGKPTFVVVDYATASRNGEPFMQLIRKRGFLPNPVARMCTQEMKIRPIHKYMREVLHADEWFSILGIRADEPSRIARIRAANGKERWENVLPLADAGVTRADVHAFWRAQPFDLQLRSWEGNCDLCFLKGADKLLRIMRDRPDLATWWAEAEGLASKPSGARFRNDRPPYSRLLQIAQEPALPGFLDENHGAIIDCMCSDDMGEEGESCGVVS